MESRVLLDSHTFPPAAVETSIPHLTQLHLPSGQCEHQSDKGSSERGGAGVEKGQLYHWVFRVSRVVVDTINEREGVESEVDEGEPQQWSYIRRHPISLDFRLFVVESRPAVHVPPHL